jgi:hypothetical protein
MTDDELAAIVAECRAKFPDPKVELVSIQTRVGTFVFRSPTAPEHKRFQDELRDDAQKAVAMRNFFVTICVYPERAEVLSTLDRYGGLLANQKVQTAIGWLNGTIDDMLGKAWPAP